MSVFLDELLDNVHAQAYRYTAEITRAERRGLGAQVRTDWALIAPVALRALDNLDTLGVRDESQQLREPLEWLARTSHAAAPSPTSAARDYAQALGVTADAVSTAAVRLQLDLDDSHATLAHLSTTLAAVARVGAAAAAIQPRRERMDRTSGRFDSLVHACSQIAHTDRAPGGGLVPSPGSLAGAISRWASSSQAALAPAEVDGRTLRSIPADLRYLHAATVVLMGAAGSPADAAREALEDAERSWGAAQQAWPPQMATQPGGRHNADQLQAARSMHDALRPLRHGRGWASAGEIRERLDVPAELRSITTLSRTQIPALGQAYATSVRTLIAEEVIAWPARHLPRSRAGNDPATLHAASRGEWVALPSDSTPAQNLVRASESASLATTCAGATLRAQAAPFQGTTRRDRGDAPRLSSHTEKPPLRHR